MTPNEISTLVASHKHKELDVPWKKMVYERVKYWRSTLIKQSLDKVRQQARFFQQTIYLPMEKINRAAMVAPLPIDVFQAVTTGDVPLPLRISDNGLFNYVGGMDGRSPFGFADAGTIAYMKAGKYSRLGTYYERWNNKIVTSDLPDIPIAMITSVFNEPEQAMMWETGVYQPDVNWWDRDIPMSGDVEQRVVQCILTVDFREPDPVKPEDYQLQTNGEQQ